MLAAFAPDNPPARVTARTSPAKRSHVPSEFRGLARRLRSRIWSRISEDAKQAHELADELLLPFRPRPGFVPMPRKTRVAALAECWKAMPSYGRLRLVCNHTGNKFSLAEFRYEPAVIFSAGWAEDEPAIGVSIRMLTIEPPRFAEHCLALTAVGLHAVACRYQRGPNKDDKQVLSDMLTLAIQVPQIVQRDESDGGEFVLPVPCWVRELDDRPRASRCLSIRHCHA
jgi:hypothetical protein